MIVDVMVSVFVPVIVAALGNGNDAVIVNVDGVVAVPERDHANVHDHDHVDDHVTTAG